MQVLLVPGSYYSPWQGSERTTTFARGEEADIGYFRLAYSMTTVRPFGCGRLLCSLTLSLLQKEEMETGIKRMTKVLMKAWEL